MLRGWQSAATLAPLVHNVAAAIAWGTWQPPAPAPDLPADPRNRQFRKALKRNAIRVRERQGALLGVHVLDLGGTITQAHRDPPTRAGDPPGRASPIPHLRTGHFRRVRVGPRDRFHYEPRWIPPVWVQGDTDKAAERLVVRRLPTPAAWDPPSRRTVGPPARDQQLPPAPGDGAFGIDLS